VLKLVAGCMGIIENTHLTRNNYPKDVASDDIVHHGIIDIE